MSRLAWRPTLNEQKQKAINDAFDPNNPANTTANRNARMEKVDSLGADTVRDLLASAEAGPSHSTSAPGPSVQPQCDSEPPIGTSQSFEQADARIFQDAQDQFDSIFLSEATNDDEFQLWMHNLVMSTQLFNETDCVEEITYAQDPQVKSFEHLMSSQLGQSDVAYSVSDLISTAKEHIAVFQATADISTAADDSGWAWLASVDDVGVVDDSKAQPEHYDYSIEDPASTNILNIDPDVLRQMLARVIVEPLTRNAQDYAQFKVCSPFDSSPPPRSPYPPGGRRSLALPEMQKTRSSPTTGV